MFSSFTDFLTDAKSKGQTVLSKVKDKNAFRRLVLGCYLIARADGDFDAAEKSALCKLIKKDLPSFSIDAILAVIDSAEEKIAFDETMGSQEIMAEVGKASGDEAGAIIRAACYIGASDGDFDEGEKNVARLMCSALGISPSQYGL